MARSSSSVVLQLGRLISRKVFAAAAGSCNNYSISAIAARSWRRQMSTFPPSSPWLMLPPDSSEGSYKFYSLAENKVITVYSGSSAAADKELTTTTTTVGGRKCRGSSCGGWLWLALLIPHNYDFFLYNPISRRHLKLPPVHTLPKENHISTYVDKVILNNHQEDCCCTAVMMYNFNDLAFCCPGTSSEWTPFSNNCYNDFVYSTSHKLFFGISRLGYLETWDLSSSPRMIKKVKIKQNVRSKAISSLYPEYKFLGQEEHLVVAGLDVLVVTQYLMENVAPDGECLRFFDKGADNGASVTIGFDMQKYDPETQCVEYLVDGCDGFSLFLGSHNQSVAFPTDCFPELKPNSIYYTDIYSDFGINNCDVGIFNCRDKTVSGCHYPCDHAHRTKQTILPQYPMWYFPSRSF